MINNTIFPETWTKIQDVFIQAQKSAMYCSIATIDADGIPNITPIGTLFLDSEIGQGFFFDTYSTTFEQNLSQNRIVCIQAVNSRRSFWLKSLIQGQFKYYPGVRLYAEIGNRCLANELEIQHVQRRIAALKWSKGSKLIWSDFTYIREIRVIGYRWVEYPVMMPRE